MDYWEECVRIAFDEEGIKATEEQIQNVVGHIEGAHENYGMSHGYDAIPNHLEEEIKKEKQKTREAEDRANRERENFRKNVAKRRGVDISQVYISDDGEATINYR